MKKVLAFFVIVVMFVATMPIVTFEGDAYALYNVNAKQVFYGHRRWSHVGARVWIYKQNLVSDGYIALIETYRVQHYLQVFDNRIGFWSGYEGSGAGPTYWAYLPRNGDNFACRNCVYGDIVGTAAGYITTIPGCFGQGLWPGCWAWRTRDYGWCRHWYRDGGASTWYSRVNIDRYGYGLTTGEYIYLHVWYRTCIYYVFWWDCSFTQGKDWYYRIP